MEYELPNMSNFMEEIQVVDNADVNYIGNKAHKSRKRPRLRIEDCWN